jgi:hypothetical protein
MTGAQGLDHFRRDDHDLDDMNAKIPGENQFHLGIDKCLF